MFYKTSWYYQLSIIKVVIVHKYLNFYMQVNIIHPFGGIVRGDVCFQLLAAVGGELTLRTLWQGPVGRLHVSV